MCVYDGMLCVSCLDCFFFFFKQKTAYEMRISDWSSDVCSSDLYEWRPCTADDRGRAEGARIEAVPMILIPDHDADIEQCAASLLTEERPGFRALPPDDAVAGPKWSDDLPRVTGLSFLPDIYGCQIHYTHRTSISSAHMTCHSPRSYLH